MKADILLFSLILMLVADAAAPTESGQVRADHATGPNVWNMTESDGVMDRLTDINSVIAQHAHDYT